MTGLTIAFAAIGLLTVAVGANQSRHFLRAGTVDGTTLVISLLMTLGLVAGTTEWLVGRTWWVAGVSLLAMAIMLLHSHKAQRLGVSPRHERSLRSPTMMLAIWLTLFFSNALQNSDFAGATVFERLLPGLVLIVVAVGWRHSALSLPALAVGASATLGVSLMLGAFAQSAWRSCDEFKCGAFGGMFTGPFSSENYLAYQAIVCAILALTQFSGARRMFVLLVSMLTLIATESRTSQLALACGVLLWAILSIRAKRAAGTRWPGPRWRRWHAAAIPVSVVITAFILIATATPTSFSNRGNIWMRAWVALKDAPVFGHGLQRWDLFQALGVVPDHFPHSEYLLIAFSGGIVGVVLFSAWLITSLFEDTKTWGALRSRLPLVTVFMVAGFAEIVWNPLAMDGLVWTALAITAPHVHSVSGDAGCPNNWGGNDHVRVGRDGLFNARERA